MTEDEKLTGRLSGIPAKSSQAFSRRFGDVLARLQGTGYESLAKALEAAQQTVIASEDLSDAQKQQRIEALNRVGEEAVKDEPDKPFLARLVEAFPSNQATWGTGIYLPIDAIIELVRHIDWGSIDLGDIDLGGL